MDLKATARDTDAMRRHIASTDPRLIFVNVGELVDLWRKPLHVILDAASECGITGFDAMTGPAQFNLGSVARIYLQLKSSDQSLHAGEHPALLAEIQRQQERNTRLDA